MYDTVPRPDVPSNNLIQRSFAQRWSAIALEIVMTIVITVAAGQAFDFFDPFEAQPATAAVQQLAADRQAPALSAVYDPLAVVKERGLEYIQARRFVAAEAIYDFAISATPEDAHNYAARAYVNMQTGDYQAAQTDYQTLLEMTPADFDGHVALCWAYGELGEFTDAFAHCDLALEYAGSDFEVAVALENRCWLQVEMGEYAGAAGDCLRVLEAFPSCQHEVCALAHYNLGRVLLAQRQIDGALRHFNRAVYVGSSYAKMYLEIAQVHSILGYERTAQASYARYAALVAPAQHSD